jgi:hypothetical protein
MNPATDEKRTGALVGTLIGDTLSMPMHWHYDRAALCRDYCILGPPKPPPEQHPVALGLHAALAEVRSSYARADRDEFPHID